MLLVETIRSCSDFSFVVKENRRSGRNLLEKEVMAFSCEYKARTCYTLMLVSSKWSGVTLLTLCSAVFVVVIVCFVMTYLLDW